MGGVTLDSPEERRDAAVAQIIAAGGSILAITPLATVADPATIVAYQVDAAASDMQVLTALKAVKTETEVDLTGLVPWVDPSLEVLDA